MKYVLDTDIWIYFFKNHQKIIDKMSTLTANDLSTTIFNKTELLFGAFKSAKIEQNLKTVGDAMKNIRVLDYSDEASHIFAQQKAKLHTQGNTLDDMDLLIASVTLANHSTLVTNNTKHFERIRGLKLENWAKL
ncbi:MAG: hypothetical protein A3E82_02295 [Gammaproteobacteria bacterium RIFCSPHIGHO2_12_FULL_38_11]|nr:MAG: hypothetical protein A3E82_02295 [Gammaproteobacteria bacterium RIFCSPHIGHO2_12_FULL_38_11]